MRTSSEIFSHGHQVLIGWLNRLGLTNAGMVQQFGTMADYRTSPSFICDFCPQQDKWLREHNGDEGGPNVATLLSYGAVSSTAGQLVAYPMQLVRTKMQAQGMPGVPNYNGALDCLRDVLQRDGVRGLYRGLGPNFVKTLPAITISYAVFETSKGALS